MEGSLFCEGLFVNKNFSNSRIDQFWGHFVLMRTLGKLGEFIHTSETGELLWELRLSVVIFVFPKHDVTRIREPIYNAMESHVTYNNATVGKCAEAEAKQSEHTNTVVWAKQRGKRKLMYWLWWKQTILLKRSTKKYKRVNQPLGHCDVAGWKLYWDTPCK